MPGLFQDIFTDSYPLLKLYVNGYAYKNMTKISGNENSHISPTVMLIEMPHFQ